MRRRPAGEHPGPAVFEGFPYSRSLAISRYTYFTSKIASIHRINQSLVLACVFVVKYLYIEKYQVLTDAKGETLYR